MVPLTERMHLLETVRDDLGLTNFSNFLKGKSCDFPEGKPLTQIDRILQAISSRNKEAYLGELKKISRRTLDESADWCCNDFLIFVLVMGGTIFEIKIDFLDSLFKIRGNTGNQVTLKIDQVLSSLNRSEFKITEEYGFLKVPILLLKGGFTVDINVAESVIQGINENDDWNQFPPYLKLLTQNSYDLVITKRTPTTVDTVDELVEGLKKHSKDFSLKHYWQILISIPKKMLFGGGVFSLIIATATFFAGLGYKSYEHIPQEVSSIPQTITIAKLTFDCADQPKEIKAISDHYTKLTNKPNSIVVAKLEPFSHSTKGFVVEMSHADLPIINAIAYIQIPQDSFQIVPVQKVGNQYRAIFQELKKDSTLVFVMHFDKFTSNNKSIKKDIKLRVVN